MINKKVYILSILETVCWLLFLSVCISTEYLDRLNNNTLSIIIRLIVGVVGVIAVNLIISKTIGTYKSYWEPLVFIVSPLRLIINTLAIFLRAIYNNVYEEKCISNKYPEEDPLKIIPFVLFGFYIDRDYQSRKSKNLRNLLSIHLPISIIQLLVFLMIIFLTLKVIEMGLFKERIENTLMIYIIMVLLLMWFLETSYLLALSREEKPFVENNKNKLKKDNKDYNTIYYRQNDILDIFDEKLLEIDNKKNSEQTNNIRQENSTNNNTNTNLETIDRWRLISPGLVTINMLLTPVNTILVLISSLISFSNSKKLFCWYGKVSYLSCKAKYIQRVLHYLFGFIIISGEYIEEEKKEITTKVSWLWSILGMFLSSTVGILVIIILWTKGGREKEIAKKMLFGLLITGIIAVLSMIVFFTLYILS